MQVFQRNKKILHWPQDLNTSELTDEDKGFITILPASLYRVKDFCCKEY